MLIGRENEQKRLKDLLETDKSEYGLQKEMNGNGNQNDMSSQRPSKFCPCENPEWQNKDNQDRIKAFQYGIDILPIVLYALLLKMVILNILANVGTCR